MSLELHIGSRRTGIAVVPDERWPGMWRVRTSDGRVSDMVNLTRAKDAGISALARERGFGLGGNEVARWHSRETAAGAPLAGETKEAA